MQQEHHVWYSERLGRPMGVRVHGHYGLPILVFPTSQGDEWEYEGMHMITHLAHHIDAGRVKIFCINSVNSDSWSGKQHHPAHRTWMQVMYDEYVSLEVFPFIRDHCDTPDIPITTHGMSLGAFHAMNTLLKHPADVRRCLALSGTFDLRDQFDGYYDDNLYFNNPVDYVSNLSDDYNLFHLRRCDIHLATGTGPWENPEPSYHFADILRSKGIPVSLDDWGAEGGHDWPYWKRMMDSYVSRLF